MHTHTCSTPRPLQLTTPTHTRSLLPGPSEEHGPATLPGPAEPVLLLMVLSKEALHLGEIPEWLPSPRPSVLLPRLEPPLGVQGVCGPSPARLSVSGEALPLPVRSVWQGPVHRRGSASFC